MKQRFERITFSGDPTGSGVALLSDHESYVHRAGTDSNITYETWIYALNADTADYTATIYWATTGGINEETGYFEAGEERGSTIIVNVPAQEGPVLIIPGFILLGNGVELWISATTDKASPGISIYGYINKITNSVGVETG